jgi:hypothetical protein
MNRPPHKLCFSAGGTSPPKAASADSTELITAFWVRVTVPDHPSSPRVLGSCYRSGPPEFTQRFGFVLPFRTAVNEYPVYRSMLRILYVSDNLKQVTLCDNVYDVIVDGRFQCKISQPFPLYPLSKTI